MTTRIKVDPAVQCYSPFIYDESGVVTDELKPFSEDPRCLFGWGPPARGCRCMFGHTCIRELGHRGKCTDGTEDGAKCSSAQRPKNWDSKERERCNGHCPDCHGPIDIDGASDTQCAAGRYGTDNPNCCSTCGGCQCDGAC